MAKAPKKRTKKGSIQTFKRKEIDAIVSNCYQRIKFLGDCFHTPRACGIQRLWTHLRGPYHDIGMDHFLRHLTREMDWSLNVSCFFKDNDNDEILHVAQSFALMPNFVMSEASAALSSAITESVNVCLKADERFSNETMIYYTYTLYPEFHESYDMIGDGLTDLMINLDNLSEFEPFNDKLYGFPSTIETLPKAIRDNGIFPRVKIRNYWPLEEEVISDDTSFLLQKPITEVECETV